MRIRPMRPDDLDAAERLTGHAFAVSAGSAETVRPPAAARRWLDRAAHLLATDPGGCWVADEPAHGVIGVATSARRDLLWLLSTYAVAPAHQGRGIGRVLLDAAVDYGAGCLRGMICALPDAGALRRYRMGGFTLHPTMRLAGVVDRSSLPVVDGVREGTDADRDLADSVDRRLRGAARGADHAQLAREGTFLVCDLMTGSGYTYANEHGIVALAATNRAIAQRLLWSGLARTAGGADVTARYLSPDQGWALDVGLAAGLRIERDGFLALRHMRPPAPYLPSVALA